MYRVYVMANKGIIVLLLLLHISILFICHSAALSYRPPPLPGTEEKGNKSKCVELASETEGPYWVEENIEASDVRGNLTYGVPLNLTFRVVDGQLSEQNRRCEPIATARLDLWQCRYDGVYSDEALDHTEGETWLRGYQFTDSSGYATFKSIYPGWYESRTVHIHVRIRMYNEDNSTSYEETTQLFFDDAISNAIFRDVYPYNARGFKTRDTFNTNDSLFIETNVISLVGDYNQDGYDGMVEFKLPLVSPLGEGGDKYPILTKNE